MIFNAINTVLYLLSIIKHHRYIPVCCNLHRQQEITQVQDHVLELTQAKVAKKTTKTTTKMATSSMLEELYQKIQGEPYVEWLNRLDPESSVDWQELPKIQKIVGGSCDIQVT